MWDKLLDILVCPACRGELDCVAAERDGRDRIRSGALDCRGCGKRYPIEAGIPRFVPRANYASSFGFQWNRFKSEQIDSNNGTQISERRFFSETGWTRDWLTGRWILEAGCGAGRFLDVARNTGAQVVGLDISSAVDAARATCAGS